MNTWDHAPEITIHNEKEIKGFFGEYRWLSNFYLCPIKGKTHVYPSSENAYQAAKVSEKNRIDFVSISPAQSKKLARSYDIDINEWDSKKLDVMYWVIKAKFTQNLDLKKKLIETGEKYLEETNYWGDTFWGVCKGKGENHLGKILMRLREEFKKD